MRVQGGSEFEVYYWLLIKCLKLDSQYLWTLANLCWIYQIGTINSIFIILHFMTVFPIRIDFVKNMHSDVSTDLYKDYIKSETEPRLQKILRGAVTFTFLPVEPWWSRTSVRHHRCRDWAEALPAWLSLYENEQWMLTVPRHLFQCWKSAFFLFNVVTSAYSRWHVSPKTNSLPFPPCQPSELTASWQAVLWAV